MIAVPFPTTYDVAEVVEDAVYNSTPINFDTIKLMDAEGYERLMIRAKISKAISGKHPSEYAKAVAEALAKEGYDINA